MVFFLKFVGVARPYISFTFQTDNSIHCKSPSTLFSLRLHPSSIELLWLPVGISASLSLKQRLFFIGTTYLCIFVAVFLIVQSDHLRLRLRKLRSTAPPCSTYLDLTSPSSLLCRAMSSILDLMGLNYLESDNAKLRQRRPGGRGVQGSASFSLAFHHHRQRPPFNH